MEFDIGLWAAIGFIFAAYAVVGNDALQTLGTFINSNQRLHWFWLFVFAAVILVATFTFGWVINEGDPSWGRLANTKKYPVLENPAWYYALPPLALVFLTRVGVPVSTSFMVLTIFATMGGLTSMLQKSLIGYGLAFVVGGLLYLVLTRTLEKFFLTHELGKRAPWGLATVMGVVVGTAVYYLPPMVNPDLQYGLATCIGFAVFGLLIDIVATLAVMRFKSNAISAAVAIAVSAVIGYGFFRFIPLSASLDLGVFVLDHTSLAILTFLSSAISLYFVTHNIRSGKVIYWVILQWVTTGYLWSIWLIQDFANIFVFLPRSLSATESFAAMFLMVALLAYTFANRGGPVQKILKSKTAVTDIRSATIIDFIYASLLFFFKEVSDIPMSTTWVFLGLIAGREYAFAFMTRAVEVVSTIRMTLGDLSKAYIGLVLSIDLARGLPALAQAMSGEIAYGDMWSAMAPSVPVANFICTANLMLIPVAWFLFTKSRVSMMVLASLFVAVTAAFFMFPVS